MGRSPRKNIKSNHSRHFQVEKDQDRERVSITVNNDFTRKIIDSFLAVRKQEPMGIGVEFDGVADVGDD